MSYNKGTGAKWKVGAFAFSDGFDLRCKAISITGNATTSETDSTYDLPSDVIVREVSALITSASSSYGVFNNGWAKSENDHDKNNIDFKFYGLPNMESMLEDIGFDYAEDLHSQNVGFMHDGRFVCIDFDHCYLPPEHVTISG